jgi:hypothetical protein
MDRNPDVVSPAGTLTAYPRAAVEDFLASAAGERARLEASILDAESRIRRARAAIGMHRVMASMLLQTQIELGEMRSCAETEAEGLLASAEEEAREIVARAMQEQGIDAMSLLVTPRSTWLRDSGDRSTGMPGPPSNGLGVDAHIDLTRAETDDPDAATEYLAGPRWGNHGGLTEDDRGDSFFAYLRGALVDNEPLGPALA